MKIDLIDGYEEIIEFVLNNNNININQKEKIDKLIRDALKTGELQDVAIRLLLEAGEYIYED